MPKLVSYQMNETSVICRHCGTLVGGVEAGSHVRWTGCIAPTQQQREDSEWVCAVPLRSSTAPTWLRVVAAVLVGALLVLALLSRFV